MLNITSFFVRKNLTFRLFLHIFLVIIVAGVTKGDIFAGPTYDEGIDYKRIYSENKYKKTKKIEVVEFFGLFCPHCRNFSPIINKWAEKLPPNVEFKKLHVPFREISHQSAMSEVAGSSSGVEKKKKKKDKEFEYEKQADEEGTLAEEEAHAEQADMKVW